MSHPHHISERLSSARDAWIHGLKGLMGSPDFGGGFTDAEYEVLRDNLKDLQRALTSEELASTHDDWKETPRAVPAAHGLRDQELDTGRRTGREWLYQITEIFGEDQ